MTSPASSSLCLLTIHAHPDDEASKGSATVAKYAAEGVRTVLVCCTGGEAGEVLNKAADGRAGYAHPDHLRVHDISGPAFNAAGDPSQYPELGEPWQPLKLYYVGGAMSAKRMQALTGLYEAIGEENPFAQWQARRRERGLPELRPDTVTTLIDVGDFLAVRRAALLAHRTQIDPEGAWMRIPDDALREAFPWDEYELAQSLVDQVPEGEIEKDLFAGIR